VVVLRFLPLPPTTSTSRTPSTSSTTTRFDFFPFLIPFTTNALPYLTYFFSILVFTQTENPSFRPTAGTLLLSSPSPQLFHREFSPDLLLLPHSRGFVDEDSSSYTHYSPNLLLYHLLIVAIAALRSES
jgi:hypothetical protein